MSASTLAVIVDSDGTRYGDPIPVAPDQLGPLQAEVDAVVCDAATDGALSVEPIEPSAETALSPTAQQIAKLQADYNRVSASAERAWTHARGRHYRGGTRGHALALERQADELASQLRTLGVEVK